MVDLFTISAENIPTMHQPALWTLLRLVTGFSKAPLMVSELMKLTMNVRINWECKILLFQELLKTY